MAEPTDLCGDCEHARSIHMDGTQECHEPGCNCSGFVDETADDADVLVEAEEFEARARKVVEQVLSERFGHDIENCVDIEVAAELDRKWDRSNPPNPFGVYESLKAANPKAYVSPGMSLRMFAAVESLARAAFNEATR